MTRITATEYIALLSRYKRKGCIVNDYIFGEATQLADRGSLYCVCGENNVALLVKKTVGMRVYYYINDFDERFDLPDEDYVIEVLFRDGSGIPEREIKYWETNGFGKNVVRDQYSCVMRGLDDVGQNEEIKVMPAANECEVRTACDLFNSSFDHLSGDYIGESEYSKLLSQKQVLVAHGESGAFLGALHCEVTEKVSWLHHLAVNECARGSGVGMELCRRWISSGKSGNIMRFMLWVQKQNLPAVSLYNKLGFKFNGKSSLSLIKRRQNDG